MDRLARRLPYRSFSSSALKRSNYGHHTYFQQGSSAVNYPEPSQNLSQWYSRTRPQFKEASVLSEPTKWLIFFGGFFTFPALCAVYYWGDWAFGSKLWKSQIQKLEEQGLARGSRGLRDADAQFIEPNNLMRILQRANAETKALHDLILLWINPEHGLHAAKDTEMIREHPIKMSNGRRLDAEKAALIRILDRDNKTLVLLLGVDMVGHNGSETDPSLFWCHDYALRNWMDARAKELESNNEASEHGISLYCYTPTSSATSLPNKKGESWQEARLFPEDLPQGFPLSAMKNIKVEIQSKGP